MVASVPSIPAAWKAPFPDPPDVAEEDAGEGVAAEGGASAAA